jgi:hypothetical protein
MFAPPAQQSGLAVVHWAAHFPLMAACLDKGLREDARRCVPALLAADRVHAFPDELRVALEECQTADAADPGAGWEAIKRVISLAEKSLWL